MAKVGTAHIEIKPVLNDEALEAIVERIQEAVARGVALGLAAHHAQMNPDVRIRNIGGIVPPKH